MHVLAVDRGPVLGTPVASRSGPDVLTGPLSTSGMKEHDDAASSANGLDPAAAPPINFNVEALGNLFWQLTVDGLAYGAIYALVAVGYTLVYGVLRLINFAHSEIFMLGMFGQYAVLMMLGLRAERQRVRRGRRC